MVLSRPQNRLHNGIKLETILGNSEETTDPWEMFEDLVPRNIRLLVGKDFSTFVDISERIDKEKLNEIVLKFIEDHWLTLDREKMLE